MQPPVMPNWVRAWLPESFRHAFLIALVSGPALAQHVTITVEPSSPYGGRPVYEAVRQLQKLTSIPINYEDLQYEFPGDTQDIAGSVLGPAQRANNPSRKVIVPKGGSFSVSVPVDPATNRLSDELGVSNALSAVISAAQAAGVIPGSFRVDHHSGTFFVEPATQHSSAGTAVPALPVLDTPVTVSVQQTAAYQVLDAVLSQVTQSTGAQFLHGMGIVWAKVSVTASSEPAKYVLSRMLAAVSNTPAGGSTPFAYHMLSDPLSHTYAFNIVNNSVLQGGPASLPFSPPPVTKGTGDPLGAPKGK